MSSVQLAMPRERPSSPRPPHLESCILALLIAGAAIAAGCAGRGERNAQSPEQASIETAAPPLDAALRGTLVLPALMALPAGARLRLDIVERFVADPLPIASRESPLKQTELGFELRFSRAGLADPTLYRLDAAVFDASGDLVLASVGEHPLNLAADAEPTRVPLTVVLSRSVARVRRFDCAGHSVELRDAGDAAQLLVAGGLREMRRVGSGDVVHFAGADAELWLSESEASLRLGGESLQCDLVLGGR